MPSQLDTVCVTPLGPNGARTILVPWFPIHQVGCPLRLKCVCVYSSTYTRGLTQSTSEGVSHRRSAFIMDDTPASQAAVLEVSGY